VKGNCLVGAKFNIELAVF